LWLVPPAEFTGIDRKNYRALDESYDLINGPQTNAAAVLARIQQGIQKNWWKEPGWRTVGGVRNPIKVPKNNWTTLQRLGRLIQDG
jgi:hypothetical protein